MYGTYGKYVNVLHKVNNDSNNDNNSSNNNGNEHGMAMINMVIMVNDIYR